MRLGAWLILASVLGALAPAGTPVGAAGPPAAAAVSMGDAGYNPSGVTIVAGGTVSWTNQGQLVHTATSIGGAPLPFDTGGLGPGETYAVGFTVPGIYYYTSTTDCRTPPTTPNFPCFSSFAVTVVSPPGSTTATPTPAPFTPTPTPPPLQNVVVNINDTTMNPPIVTVALNGTVVWFNQGSSVHTATSTGGSTMPSFDTGGIGPNQIATFSFTTPGTYVYTSSTDCITRSNPGAFNCGPYTVNVLSTLAAQPATPTPAPATPTAIPPLAAPNPNPTVSITDGAFQPLAITVKAGQTVTWTNQGTAPHTVTSNQGYSPTFDSGGLAPGGTFSVAFPTPGSYAYHSTIEATYSFDSINCKCVVASFALNGVVNVTP